MSDFPLESPQENLSWTLKQTGYDQGKTDNAGLTINPALSFPWPDDPNERVWTPVYMSLNEYTALASAVDVGAAIAWTNDALLVYYILVRNYSGGAMQFCEKIIDCVANDNDVKRAIVDMLKANDEFNQYLKQTVYRLTGPQIEGNLVPGDCDNSVVAGRAIALVDRLAENCVDFLESVEVGTNDEERASAVIGAIPVIGESPVDEVLDIAQEVLSDFAENWNAINTFERRDAMARDIYCLMLKNEDCSITFQQLFDYFQMKAISGLNIASTIIDVVGFLFDGDFDNDDALWFGLFALQIGFVLNSRDFYGINPINIGTIMRDASSSSAWEDWDECEDTWQKTWNFASGEIEGWDIGNGNFVSGYGFKNPGSGPYPSTVDIGRDVTWPGGSELRKVTILATSTVADAAGFRGVYYPNGEGAPQIGYTSNTGNYTMQFDANNPTPSRVEIQVSNTAPSVGENTIRSVTLAGIGTEPTW